MKNQLTKLNIIYIMKRKNEVSEASIELPVSHNRYEELAKGIDSSNKVWQSVQQALLQLTYLQGYDVLGEWSVELKIYSEV